MRYSNEMRFGTITLYSNKSTYTLHLDKDIIIKTAQLLSPKLLCNNSMACGQSNGATIQANIFDISQRF